MFISAACTTRRAIRASRTCHTRWRRPHVRASHDGVLFCLTLTASVKPKANASGPDCPSLCFGSERSTDGVQNSEQPQAPPIECGSWSTLAAHHKRTRERSARSECRQNDRAAPVRQRRWPFGDSCLAPRIEHRLNTTSAVLLG
jgi:hypothetical protein